MLKSAQVTSLQQRETSMQKKLFACLSRFTQEVTMQLSERPPTEEFNLPELLHLTGSYLEDVLRFDQHFKYPASGSHSRSKNQQRHRETLQYRDSGRKEQEASSISPHDYADRSSGGGERGNMPLDDTISGSMSTRLSPSRPAPRRPMY